MYWRSFSQAEQDEAVQTASWVSSVMPQLGQCIVSYMEAWNRRWSSIFTRCYSWWSLEFCGDKVSSEQYNLGPGYLYIFISFSAFVVLYWFCYLFSERPSFFHIFHAELELLHDSTGLPGEVKEDLGRREMLARTLPSAKKGRRNRNQMHHHHQRKQSPCILSHSNPNWDVDLYINLNSFQLSCISEESGTFAGSHGADPWSWRIQHSEYQKKSRCFCWVTRFHGCWSWKSCCTSVQTEKSIDMSKWAK